jgi:hypothetical protein
MADVTKQGDLKLFIQEVRARFKEGSPKFFRVFGDYSLVHLAIGFIPELLVLMNIALPPKWVTLVGYVAKGAGAMGRFVAGLPVKLPTSEAMPFTEKKQIQQAEKKLSNEINETN